MQKLKTITLENDNYHIFKVEQKQGILEIYFIWGKTDFRTIWTKVSEIWVRKNLQIFKHSRWYSYVKVTEHGVNLEETYWTHNDKDIFIDLPMNFSSIADRLFQKVLPNYYIT